MGVAMGQTAEAMMPGGFRKLAGLPMPVQRLQQAVDDATRQSRERPQNTASTIRGIAIPDSAATPNTVRVVHKLGRKPQGYRQIGNTTGHAQYFETARDEHSITFQSASTPATVDMDFY